MSCTVKFRKKTIKGLAKLSKNIRQNLESLIADIRESFADDNEFIDAGEVFPDLNDVSKIESGKRPIGKALAKRIEKEFKIDYRRFL